MSRSEERKDIMLSNLTDVLEPHEIPLDNPEWELQPRLGEDKEDYQMFLVYAGLSPSDRTYTKAWDEWSGGGTQMSSTFYNKAKKYLWARRAAAWDIDKMQRFQADWIARDEFRREEDYAIAKILREIALENLDNMTGNDLSPNTVARFIELASKLQEDAVPKFVLQQDEVKRLVQSLPEERRKNIIGILFARNE